MYGHSMTLARAAVAFSRRHARFTVARAVVPRLRGIAISSGIN